MFLSLPIFLRGWYSGIIQSSKLLDGGSIPSPRAMSLLSQTDRQMVIEALEFYINNLKMVKANQVAIMAFQTLLLWVELEYSKHEVAENLTADKCSGNTGVS